MGFMQCYEYVCFWSGCKVNIAYSSSQHALPLRDSHAIWASCSVMSMCVFGQVVRQSGSDQVTVVGACVTLVEALKAADELASGGINIRVIDPFTIKPIDVDTILHSARQTGGRLVIVEDHYPEGSTCSLPLTSW